MNCKRCCKEKSIFTVCLDCYGEVVRKLENLTQAIDCAECHTCKKGCPVCGELEARDTEIERLQSENTTLLNRNQDLRNKINELISPSISHPLANSTVAVYMNKCVKLEDEIAALTKERDRMREALDNISNCRHLPNCGYIHAPCVCHRKIADNVLHPEGGTKE